MYVYGNGNRKLLFHRPSKVVYWTQSDHVIYNFFDNWIEFFLTAAAVADKKNRIEFLEGPDPAPEIGARVASTKEVLARKSMNRVFIRQ